MHDMCDVRRGICEINESQNEHFVKKKKKDC